MSEKEDFWKKVFKDKRISMSDETLKEISEYASFVPVLSKKDKPAKDVMSIEEAKKIVDKYWNGNGLKMTRCCIVHAIKNTFPLDELTEAYVVLFGKAFDSLEGLNK